MDSDSERDTRSPPSAANTNAIPAVASTGASMFASASTPSVYGSELNNSQRDQNTYTFDRCTVLNVGESIWDTPHVTLVASEIVKNLAIWTHEGPSGLNRVQTDSERRATSPPSTSDAKATSAMASIEASIFSGASSQSGLGGEASNSQRDQNRATITTNFGGSDLDTSHPTLAAGGTSRPGSVRNTPMDQIRSSILQEPSILTDSGLGNDTSSEIVSPPTEQQRSAEEAASTSCVIYKHHMLLEGHGMPLYIPQPTTSHCDLYLRQGVSIGDVGVVTPLGNFDRFFNICLPAGHALNPDVLPEGFYPIGLTPAQVQVTQIPAHLSDTYIVRPSARRTGTTFRCSEPEGAILAMPEGAYHEDLSRYMSTFKAYAGNNLASWYDYANVVHGLEIENGKICLVQGCDKTALWGIATYSHSQSKRAEDDVTYLSFNVENEGGRSKYDWSADGMAIDLKVGPEDVGSLDPPETHARMTLQNQCTFIRSLNLALGDDQWKQHQLKVAASAEAQASPPPTRNSPLASVLGTLKSLLSYLGYLRGQASGSTDSIAPAQTLSDHPATPILDMLLQKCPRAKVVVVNDSDWCSVIRDSDKDWIITAQDIPHRIQKAFDIVEDDNGIAYLQEKSYLIHRNYYGLRRLQKLNPNSEQQITLRVFDLMLTNIPPSSVKKVSSCMKNMHDYLGTRKMPAHQYIAPESILDTGPYRALVTPWYSYGNILDFINKWDVGHGRKLGLILQIAQGLAFLHSLGIIHGNLYPANVLVTDDEDIALTDAEIYTGVLKLVLSPSGCIPLPQSTVYKSGRELDGEEVPTKSADVYAFASTCHAVLTGQAPFSKIANPYQRVLKIAHPDGHRALPKPTSTSPILWDLLMRCWSPEPAQRPTMDDVVYCLGRVRRSYLLE